MLEWREVPPELSTVGLRELDVIACRCCDAVGRDLDEGVTEDVGSLGRQVIVVR